MPTLRFCGILFVGLSDELLCVELFAQSGIKLT
jgi:hypothetical protein